MVGYCLFDSSFALSEPEPLHHVADTEGAVRGAEDALNAVKPARRVVPALAPGAWHIISKLYCCTLHSLSISPEHMMTWSSEQPSLVTGAIFCKMKQLN